jgi:vitamin B12 transporter
MLVQAAIEPVEITVTASRTPQEQSESAASVTIVDPERIARLGEPLVPALLRLTPSAAIATSGPAGSLTELRIRGAEANHTLLFIDGIRANDPAAGNAPRFELLNADLASRLEVVRGPQSALWGSEAIGGVVEVTGLETPQAASFTGELGSFGSRRAAVAGGTSTGKATLNFGLGLQRARGIDSFSREGERDGYRNLSARLRGTFAASPSVELGASAFTLNGRSEFDGFDPLTFARADTLDSTRNRLSAGRLWSRFGEQDGPWRGLLSASWLGSSNRNLLDGDEINRTRGRRTSLSGQLERRFRFAGIDQQLVLAGEHEREAFRARDLIYGGFSNQDRDRNHQALTAEWRASTGPVTADLALRHDRFNRFKDATSLRASLLAQVGAGFSVAGSYGEGIAQPSFFDLYGFFPGSFVGNPSLQPESSRGVEASLRYRGKHLHAALTGYRQRLSNEIVDLFDSATFLSTAANRDERSRRSGLEAELGWALPGALRVTGHYAFLDASEPGGLAAGRVREVRRPKHSGAIAADGEAARWRYGLSLAFTGARRDMNFDVFPAAAVRLDSYWLAGARLGYQVRDGVELFARAANAFDARYQDVFGYRTEGRSLHAGLRLAARR